MRLTVLFRDVNGERVSGLVLIWHNYAVGDRVRQYVGFVKGSTWRQVLGHHDCSIFSRVSYAAVESILH